MHATIGTSGAPPGAQTVNASLDDLVAWLLFRCDPHYYIEMNQPIGWLSVISERQRNNMSIEPVTDLEKLADRYVVAYNTGDYDFLGELLDENVRMRHYPRGVDNTGSQPAIQMMRDFTAILPDKGFDQRSLIKQVAPDSVVIRHVWGGTPLEDVPGFGQKGELIAMEVATFMTFADGRLVDYQDFG
jgi:predicted ester cyclase